MGAYATLSIPLDFSSPRAREFALEVGLTTAGSIEPAVNDQGLSLKMQMPGNVGSIIRKLRGLGFRTPEQIGVSVPVRSLAIPDKVPDVEHMLGYLEASGEVFEPKIEGDAVTAYTGPTSKGLYRIFYALIHEGLIAQDTPTLVALRGL